MRPSTWLGLVGLLMILFAYTSGCSAQKWQQAQPYCINTETGKTVSFVTRKGAESGNFTDGQIKQFARDLGLRAKIVDYADPVTNMVGLLQRCYYVVISGTKNPEGTLVYFHGGGGDRGFVDNFGSPQNTESTIGMVRWWTNQGYDVVLVEYPRGWMEPQFCDDCPWNTSDAAYGRQEAAARQSFHYSRLAMEDISKRASGPIYLSGTSFGGAIVLYLTGWAPKGFAESVGIKAGLVGYGASLDADPVNDFSVPLLFVGGVDDNIVPADIDNIYFNSKAIVTKGVRASYYEYASLGGVAGGIFSAGGVRGSEYQPVGHGYGLFKSNLEVYGQFLDWAQDPRPLKQNRLPRLDDRGRLLGVRLQEDDPAPRPIIPNCK